MKEGGKREGRERKRNMRTGMIRRIATWGLGNVVEERKRNERKRRSTVGDEDTDKNERRKG